MGYSDELNAWRWDRVMNGGLDGGMVREMFSGPTDS